MKYFYLAQFFQRISSVPTYTDGDSWASHLIYETDYFSAERVAKSTCPEGYKLTDVRYLGSFEELVEKLDRYGYVELLYT